MLLLSTERLLANEHSVQRKALHLHGAFCKKGLDFTVPLLLQLFHLVTSCKKRIKEVTPSLCCSNRLFSDMVLMYRSCFSSLLSCPPLAPTFQSQIAEVSDSSIKSTIMVNGCKLQLGRFWLDIRKNFHKQFISKYKSLHQIVLWKYGLEHIRGTRDVRLLIAHPRPSSAVLVSKHVDTSTVPC